MLTFIIRMLISPAGTKTLLTYLNCNGVDVGPKLETRPPGSHDTCSTTRWRSHVQHSLIHYKGSRFHVNWPVKHHCCWSGHTKLVSNPDGLQVVTKAERLARGHFRSLLFVVHLSLCEPKLCTFASRVNHNTGPAHRLVNVSGCTQACWRGWRG